jgi:PAS domain S-box-containing protein
MLLTRLADGRIAEVNDAFSGISGYGQAEAAGKTTVELNLWADEKDRALVVDELSVSGKAGGKEFRFRRKSGELLTGLFSADIIQIGVEKLVLSNITDITERKRAEEALKESEERYRTLVEEATEAIAVYDLQMERFIDFNRNAEILFGCSRGELMKEGVQKFYSQTQPDGRSVNESFHEHRERCSGGEPLIFERVVRRPDGTERYCEVRLVRLPSRDRKLIRTSYIDITDRKRMEQEKEKLQGQLLQSQKMEAVGRLAGGVAHDFNNLLTGITGHVQLALMDVEEGGTLHESLVEINKAAESAAGLTRQLLAFSRKQIAVPVVIDLGKVVRGMDKFLKRVLGEDVRLSIETPIAPSPVKIDPVQLEQVIVNLAVNSRLAMPEGGEITIRVSDEWVKEADKVAHPGVAAGNNVMISVTDTGCGMTEEVKGHVFEPFFTTRELGKGTGLGLSTVYGIVKQNGGAIEFDSEPGRGTTFRIYLPRVDGKSEDGGTRMYGERSAGGDETIVLVEDEAVVRDVAERILKKLGYTVRSFAGGAEALAALEKSADPPHMLVTDVVMPGMNGKMLAEKMACLRPGIKVLFTSGYTDNLLVSDDERNFIAKPYTPQGLAKKVREILDG